MALAVVIRCSLMRLGQRGTLVSSLEYRLEEKGSSRSNFGTHRFHYSGWSEHHLVMICALSYQLLFHLENVRHRSLVKGAALVGIFSTIRSFQPPHLRLIGALAFTLTLPMKAFRTHMVGPSRKPSRRTMTRPREPGLSPI